ncbi:MAG: glycerol-3-phosphate 1-O-acyltransferase PlsY [Candidatus Electrothrix sp. YB6]
MPVPHFLLIAASYLIGAIPFGLLLSRSRGVNIREQGSRNIGATNVSRLAGRKTGSFTFLLDCGKGYLPMLAADILAGSAEHRNLLIALCGGAAVVGHMFPVYLRFRGGKGVATGLGIFLYLAPAAVLFSLFVFIVVVATTGFVSLGSLLGSAAVLPCLYFFSEPSWKIILAGCTVLLIWIRHSQNIRRLLRGTEESFRKKAL